LFQPGKQKAKTFRRKGKEFYRSAIVQADATEENGNQTEDVICTYCKGKFSDDVQGEIWVQ
jgi:hypothetical protein